MTYRILILILLTLASASSYGFESYRVGNRLILVGDPVAKLLQIVGDPVYKEPIQNRYGAFEGERWQYQLDDSVVTFTIRDAKIVYIEQIRS